MGWVRKLVRQGGTHLVTIPHRCVDVMGVKAGQHVWVQQPFSGAILISPVAEEAGWREAEAVRTLGYALGRVDMGAVGRHFVLREMAEKAQCTCCRRWQAAVEIVGGVVCEFCVAELATVIRLRQEPEQAEMDLAQ